MKIKKNRIVLFILIVFLSIGYALLTSTFTFTGLTSVLGNTWDFHLENIQVLNGSVAGTAPTIESNRISVNFTTVLTKPGDFYAFTVDAVNGGTIAIEVESIEKNQLNEYASKFIRYEILNTDDSEVEQGQEIPANSRTTFKVIVEYREDILPTDLYAENQNLNFEFTMNFTQANLRGDYNKAVFARLIRKDAGSDKFLDIATSSNGKGVYMVYTTQKDRYPVYYYRGDVDYNNAKFAGFCWKIVRTTETGGTKLIYYGLPDENGYCTATDTDTQIGTSTFNENHQLPLDGGYMYGDAYKINTFSGLSGIARATNVTYNETSNVYSLAGTTTSNHYFEGNYHYSCFSGSSSCSEIKYIYYQVNKAGKYLTLKNGENILDALERMKEPRYDSIAKTIIDLWFKENIIPYFTNKGLTYNSYIEDTVWCNDRSYSTSKYGSNQFNLNTSTVSISTSYYAADQRGGYPTVKCANKIDSFTVSDYKRGNGALTYPIGMLTRDELVMAGQENGYLGNSGTWWTMTPYMFDSSSIKLYNLGGNSSSSTELGIRPSISIRPEVLVKEGTDGTATNPYEFLVQ